jgi:hypothetical protein
MQRFGPRIGGMSNEHIEKDVSMVANLCIPTA